MAHFDYPPGTPTGVVPASYVLPSTDWSYTIAQIFKAINGDDGGTWAPGAFITVGGAGFQFTGTGHSLAAAARLTVQSTGEIRVADGGMVRLDGTGAANIDMKVVSGVPLIDVESGGAIRIKNGGSLDVFGSLSLKDTSGPGTITAEANTTITLLSGATLTASSGTTVNLTGSTLVRGTLTIRNSGGPGSFVMENGTSATLAGLMTYSALATNNWVEGAILQGVVTRTGIEKLSGTGARTAYRAAFTLTNADADVTVEYDRYNVPLIISAARTYTVRHTGTVPRTGERIRFNRTGLTTPSATFGIGIVREDLTVIFKFYAEHQGFCEIEWDGSNWILIAGYQTTGGTSGYYDDVW